MIAKREGDITRIEAFSDAMLGFAATLLVVSLDAPRTYDQLVANIYGFVPFGLSFTALFFIWVVHTNIFRRYPLSDTVSVVINGILLFTVLFYVFPLKFMASALASRFTGHTDAIISSWEQLQTLFIIYSVGWTLVFICVTLLHLRAWSTRRALGLSHLESYDAFTQARYYAGFVLAGVISVIVAFSRIGLAFGLPGIIYAPVIGFYSWWNGSTRAHRRMMLSDDRLRVVEAAKASPQSSAETVVQ